MKWTSILLIVGGAAAIGAISYLIYNQLHNSTCTKSTAANIQPDNKVTQKTPMHSDETTQSESDFSEQKQSAVKKIYTRHNESGRKFNDTLDIVLNSTNNTAETITQNSSQLNEIDNDLDDLLN